MPRTARRASGGMLFHVLNRGNARAQIFDDDEDYRAFQRVLTDTLLHVPMRILAYCLMPNHWHVVLWPREDGDLGEFMRRVTTTHVRRWHLHRQSVGTGHLYQGTYKSFAIQKDEHLLTVCRYVERNPVRAKLVDKAEDWPWSSLWQRLHLADGKGRPSLSEWPVAQPADWVEWVSRPETPTELEAMRGSVTRGRPYGEASWQRRIAATLGLESTFRPRGRPRKI